MALQTFEVQILDRVGEALAGDLGLDTEMLDDWLTQGARTIIARMPKPLWKLFAIESATFAPTTGLAVESQKVINVFRNDGTIDQPARRIPWHLRGRASDSSDINYNTITDPGWYIDPTASSTPMLKILPASATATIGKAIYVNFPDIDADTDTSVNGFPNDLEPLLILYALMRVKEREAQYFRRLAQGAVSSSISATNYSSPGAFTLSSTRIIDALVSASAYVNSQSSDDFKTHLGAEDVELAESAVTGARTELERAERETAHQLARLRKHEADIQDAGMAVRVGEGQAAVLVANLQRMTGYLNASASALRELEQFRTHFNEQIQTFIATNANLVYS